MVLVRPRLEKTTIKLNACRTTNPSAAHVGRFNVNECHSHLESEFTNNDGTLWKTNMEPKNEGQMILLFKGSKAFAKIFRGVNFHGVSQNIFCQIEVIGKQYAPFTQLPPMPGFGGGQENVWKISMNGVTSPGARNWDFFFAVRSL